MEENNVMNNNIENEVTEEKKDGKVKSFFKRHKVGTAIAGVSGAVIAGLAIIGSIAGKKQDDVNDLDEDDEDYFDDPELDELDLENGSTEDDSEK